MKYNMQCRKTKENNWLKQSPKEEKNADELHIPNSGERIITVLLEKTEDNMHGRCTQTGTISKNRGTALTKQTKSFS